MTSERFLVTGALGCLGAWIVSELLDEGAAVVTFDAGEDPYRLRYLIDEQALAGVTQIRGDIADRAAVRAAVVDNEITNVIHLAALQVPFCAANPPLGAMVNVVGTVNVFEAVRDTPAAERPVVYSSSVAAYDAIDDPAGSLERPTGRPGSHYGVYKLANEAGARVFARDDGLTSVGLRPSVVYGVGRDQGRTSSPTAAMLAAARGEPYEIDFAGSCQLQHGRDVARAFIAASRSRPDGAAVVDVAGPTVALTEVVEAIAAIDPAAAARISVTGDPLPFPDRLSSDEAERLLGELPRTPLQAGVAETIETFQRLLASAMIPSSGIPNVVR